MTKKTAYLLLILLTSSCTWFYHPATLELDVPDGPPEYKAGWYDGCRSGLSTKKMANTMPYNVTFGSGVYQQDTLYQSAWNSGFLACNTESGTWTSRHPFQYAPMD